MSGGSATVQGEDVKFAACCHGCSQTNRFQARLVDGRTHQPIIDIRYGSLLYGYP